MFGAAHVLHGWSVRPGRRFRKNDSAYATSSALWYHSSRNAARFLLAASSLLIFTSVTSGCSSGGTTTTGGTTPEGDAGADTGGGANDPTCEAQVQPAQTASQRCCLSYGIDACGANLVCAALGGRKVATCYTQGSQHGGETCTDDISCSSDTCRSKFCAGNEGDSCNEVGGCTGSLVCPNASSDGNRPAARCEKPGTKIGIGSAGPSCTTCATQADCNAQDSGSTCSHGTCKYQALTPLLPADAVPPQSYVTWLGARCCTSGTAGVNKNFSQYECK